MMASWSRKGLGLVVPAMTAVAVVAACYTGPAVDQAYYGGQEGVAASGCRPNIESIRTTVFLPRCATSGCHAGASPAGALDLESMGVEQRLSSLPAASCGGQVLVRPGDPDHSYLVEKLAASKPSCGDRMPSQADSLPADDIACIRSWIGTLPSTGGTTDGGVDAGGPTCEPGLVSCPSGCVDTTSDPKNCGACGTTCPVVCAKSACSATCPAPTTNCSGACVDTATSASNCGACGNKCPTGKVCAGGTCSCGGSPISFAGQIQPILTANCATTGCHVGVQPKAGLLLTAGKSYGELVNVASSACAGKSLVVPGAVDQSYLMNKLTGVGMCAGTAMPKAGGQLPADQIDLFRSWICNGAPND